jgi:hypothetical protein
MRTRLPLVLFISALGTVACGGGGETATPVADTGTEPSGDATFDGNDATGEVTDVPPKEPSADAVAACTRYVDAQHAFGARCGEFRSIDAVNHAVFREESIRRCGFSMGRSGVTVTLATLDACSAALESDACSYSGPSACAFRGIFNAADACSSGWQCKSGSCSPVGTDGRCGICLRGDGEACTSPDQCGAGLRCEASKCVAPKPGALGAACDGFNYCEHGLRCVAGMCVTTEGSACTGSSCPALYRCSTASTCTLATRAKEGEACGGTTICESYLDCDGGRCRKRTYKPTGASCSSDTECSSMRCDRTSNTCIERWPDGSACTLSTMSRCLSSWCISGTCQIPESLACLAVSP